MIRRVITIDGLAGSGKTTLARELAKQLGWVHFNSGLLYRAAARCCLNAGVDTDNAAEAARLVSKHQFSLVLQLSSAGAEPVGVVLCDNAPITQPLQTPEVSEATSKISQHGAVRDLLTEVQRQAFASSHLVAEGRDMGTIIFPDAEVKFFVTATPECRMQRRLSQLYGDLTKLPATERATREKEMLREIVERDERDCSRAVAPTKPAAGAIMIDNGAASLGEVLTKLRSYIRE